MLLFEKPSPFVAVNNTDIMTIYACKHTTNCSPWRTNRGLCKDCELKEVEDKISAMRKACEIDVCRYEQSVTWPEEGERHVGDPVWQQEEEIVALINHLQIYVNAICQKLMEEWEEKRAAETPTDF